MWRKWREVGDVGENESEMKENLLVDPVTWSLSFQIQKQALGKQKNMYFMGKNFVVLEALG